MCRGMTDTPNLIGLTFGHYRVVEEIGAGGMGVVYRARDEYLHRDVALKCLPYDEKAMASRRDQLMREARCASALNHPNICTIYSVDEKDGQLFIAMEFLAGQTLKAAIPEKGIPPESVVRWGVEIADALDHAHAHGIIHRDLKTRNVIITPEGRAKVLDFGLAEDRAAELEGTTRSVEAFSQSSGLAGTLPYMAPELFSGAHASVQSDIWALGVVLYEMAAGRLPFHAATSFALSSAIITQPAEPLSPKVPAGLRAVIRRCLAKDPRQRIQHAGEVRAALEVVASSSDDYLDLTVSTTAPEVESIPSPGPTARRTRLWLVIGTSIAGLMVSFWALYAFHEHGRFLGLHISPHIHSVAVLPLTNISAEPEQAYFADGMTEELINALSRISALRVISRSSVMKYKGVHKTPAEIARELNVDAVVEGTVHRTDGRVKISADLVDVREDRSLWGHSYEVDLRDVRGLQSQVAEAIADEIQVQLTPEESAVLSKRPVVNPQAYESYLRGRYLWNRRTPEDLHQALDEFEKSIELDPKSALAWAGLADCYTVLATQSEMAPRTAMPLAEAAAKKALELDDSLAQPHASLGLIELTYGWNMSRAGGEFERALALNPSYASAREWHGIFLNYSGRFDEALEETKRAQALDPLSPVIQVNVGRCYYYARRYDKARELLKQLELKEPNFWMVPAILGQNDLADGKYEDAIQELDRARTLSPSTLRNLGVLGDAYGRAGRRKEALNIAEDLDIRSRTHYVLPIYSALVYMGIGDKTRAFVFLDKAYSERSEWMMELNVEPEFDPLRSDPRFQTLLHRIAESAPNPSN
jgi:eukaryotic-like serine/threonine-protein kinase